MLDDCTYLFCQECGLLHMMPCLESAQVLNYLGIDWDLLNDMQKGQVYINLMQML